MMIWSGAMQGLRGCLISCKRLKGGLRLLTDCTCGTRLDMRWLPRGRCGVGGVDW